MLSSEYILHRMHPVFYIILQFHVFISKMYFVHPNENNKLISIQIISIINFTQNKFYLNWNWNVCYLWNFTDKNKLRRKDRLFIIKQIKWNSITNGTALDFWGRNKARPLTKTNALKILDAYEVEYNVILI